MNGAIAKCAEERYWKEKGDIMPDIIEIRNESDNKIIVSACRSEMSEKLYLHIWSNVEQAKEHKPNTNYKVIDSGFWEVLLIQKVPL